MRGFCLLGDSETEEKGGLVSDGGAVGAAETQNSSLLERREPNQLKGGGNLQ